MTERSCGQCTLCCHTLGVEELGKPALKWCEHCEIGVGCKIYEARPKSCRDFACLWLSHPSVVPEAAQPHRTGVVIWVTEGGKHAIALTRRYEPEAWRKPVVYKVLRKLAKNMIVIAFSGTRAWVIGRRGDEELTPDTVKFDGLVNKITISPEAFRRVSENNRATL